MNKDAVQHERGPRNSTLRRQMAMYKDGMAGATEVNSFQQDLLFRSLPMRPSLLPPYVLDLSRSQPFVEATPTYAPPIASPPHTITPPPETALESVRETAAQLLFINLRWIRDHCKSQQLSMTDQLLLIEESWSELFIIAVAQNLIGFNFNPLLCAYDVLSSNRLNGKQNAVIGSEVQNFQNILFKFAQLSVDEKEYNYLRAIILFKNRSQSSSGSSCGSPCSSNEKSLQDASKMSSLCEETLQTLATYIKLTKPTQTQRYKTFLILLDQLKTVSSLTIEELFFRRTIGHITMVKVMSDMYSQDKILNTM